MKSRMHAAASRLESNRDEAAQNPACQATQARHEQASRPDEIPWIRGDSPIDELERIVLASLGESQLFHLGFHEPIDGLLDGEGWIALALAGQKLDAAPTLRNRLIA